MKTTQDSKSGLTKKKVDESISNEESEEFVVKDVKREKCSGFSYKKKNTESNIVNQTFSFLCSDKSTMLVKAFFKENSEKVE